MSRRLFRLPVESHAVLRQGTHGNFAEAPTIVTARVPLLGECALVVVDEPKGLRGPNADYSMFTPEEWREAILRSGNSSQAISERLERGVVCTIASVASESRSY